MQKYLGYLKVSSWVVKIVAWIFLLLGFIGGISILLGPVPASANPYSRWVGLILIVVYTFFFLFLFLIAKMADLLAQIIKEVKKD
jgi:hypothetical protein